MNPADLLSGLFKGLASFTWDNALMLVIGAALITLAVTRVYEPALLLPVGFGCILANIPLAGMSGEQGLFGLLSRVGLDTGIFPLLILLGVGALVDFSPLLSRPWLVLFSAAGQVGIFGVFLLAGWLGFPLNEAASIGILAGLDIPTSLYVASRLAPNLLAPVAIAIYLSLNLIPLLQPGMLKLLTSQAERGIRMDFSPRPIPRWVLIAFPVITTLVMGLLLPAAAPLISMFMLGNLLKESGVVNRLGRSAQNEILNIATLFLGLVIGSGMSAQSFLNLSTLKILLLGLLAFPLNTLFGLLFGKLACFLSRGRVNPLIGAASIPAFPPGERMAARLARDEDALNNEETLKVYIQTFRVSSNSAGQLGNLIAGGVLLAVVSGLL